MHPTDGADAAPAPVVIVGAGAAGLSTGAALKRLGHEPVLLDRDDRIGGTWARRYDRLSPHTVRSFSGLAHLALPKTYPRYVPKDLYARYLEEYARRFALDVRLGEPVRRVRQSGGDPIWEIETETRSWRARTVVLATGHYNERIVPRWPGRDLFRGRVVHSGDYRSGREFAGQRVLVVGIGNSGAEIAADLAEQGAARIAVAVRTPPPIMPRDLFGFVPVQLLGILLQRFPAALVDRAGAITRRVAVGELRRYGLGKAAWGPFTARRPPVIDVGFLRELKRGRVQVLPDVSRFTADGVVFADGREEPFEVVVAATGFETGLARLLDVPDAVDERGNPRFRSGRPTAHPGLYFAGFDESVRGHLFEAKREGLRLARSISAYLASRA